MSTSNLEWPAKRTEELKALWASGHSAREISDIFAAGGFFVSRNAIIGKVQRAIHVSDRVSHIPARKTAWPDSSVATLKTLWMSRTSTEIAEIISRTGHIVSVFAVRRKRARLDLPNKKTGPGKGNGNGATTLRCREREKPRQRRIAPPPPPPPPVPVAYTGPSINILDDNLKALQCRLIVAGNGVDTMFCGAPVDPASAFRFCAFHAQGLLNGTARQRQAWSPEQRAAYAKARGWNSFDDQMVRSGG